MTALADANKQMAEAYAIGAKTSAGQSHSGSYYKMRSDYYNTARAFLADGMQAVMDQRSKLGATPLVIELTFPGFQGTNAAINKIKSGQPVSDNDQLSAEQQAIRDALARGSRRGLTQDNGSRRRQRPYARRSLREGCRVRRPSHRAERLKELPGLNI